MSRPPCRFHPPIRSRSFRPGHPPAARSAPSGAAHRIAVATHVVGGLIYSLAVTAAYAFVVGSMLAAHGALALGWRFAPGILLFCLFYTWPLVIVVSLLMKLSWRTMGMVVIVSAAVFVGAAWLMLGGVSVAISGPMRDIAASYGGTAPPSFGLWQIGQLWWSVNGVATLLVLAFLVRPIRAIGPVVLALAMAAVAGAIGMVYLLAGHRPGEWLALAMTKLGINSRVGVIAVLVVVLALAAIVVCFIGYLALRAVGLLYRAQRVSDQSIQVYAVWLVFALAQSPPPGMPYGCLAAFVLYVVVVRLGLRMFGNRRPAGSPVPRLLFLRVFSLGKRSEAVFDAFTRTWRYTGPVRLIAGPDLATTTVELHEFLDFLGGRLQRRFITGPAALDQRLAEISARPDPDGRFRVAELFCHADTWQMTLRRLVGDCDAVMMDLRGFTSNNAGCIFELHELLDTVPLDRVLLIVDHTTDQGFLADVLRQGWLCINPESPNRPDADPRIRLYRLDTTGSDRIAELVATVAQAGVRRPVTAAA